MAVPPLTSNFDKGVNVPMPTLPDEFQTPEPGNQAAFATVRYVVEALVIVPLVDQKLVAVKLVDEAFNVYVVVATVRFPAKNPLPFTESNCPGVEVPMPTLPLGFSSICLLLDVCKIKFEEPPPLIVNPPFPLSLIVCPLGYTIPLLAD